MIITKPVDVVCGACGVHGNIKPHVADMALGGFYGLLWLALLVACVWIGASASGVIGAGVGFVVALIAAPLIALWWGFAASDAKCPMCGGTDALLPLESPIAQKLLLDTATPRSS